MTDYSDISPTTANVNEDVLQPINTHSAIALVATQNAFVEIMKDENAHVTFFMNALAQAGVNPRPKPTFKGLLQSSRSDFVKLARIFENVGVGAFLMAMPAISKREYQVAAGSILTIEARHAGFVNALLSKPLSDNGAFDKAITQADIVKGVSPFIESLNGGPDPAGQLYDDIAILNFALLLEYLEAEFYSTNVPKLFA